VITGQSSFCIGNSTILDAGPGYTNYLWDDASINSTLEVFTSGTHSVTVTDANGCTGQASFTASEIPSLTPVITGNLSFCEGSSTILDAGAGYTTYEWSTGDITQIIEITTGGNIGVIVTDADGCSGSTNITATINPNPDVVIGGSTTFCIGGSTILDAGQGYSNYNWNTTETTQEITVTMPGNFSVDVIDANGCAGSASVIVTESTSLSPVITGNNAFCENGNTTLNAGSGFATYLWSDGSTNQTLYIDSAGIYAVTVSDGQSCSGEATVSISEVLPPSAQLQPTTTLCNTTAGGSVINLYSLVLSGDNTGSWNDVDNSGAVGLFTNLNFNNVAAGDYRFTYTTNSAVAPCPEAQYQVIVTILDCTCPDVFFYTAAPLCNAGDMLDLNSIENTTEPGDWAITQTPPGSNPSSLTGTIFDATSGDPGLYTLEYTLQNQPPPGCPIDFQIMVEVDASVDAGIALQPVEYCFGENILVDLAILINGEDLNGTWKETSSNPSQGAAFNQANGTFQTLNQIPQTYTFEYAMAANGACPEDASEVAVIINPLPIAVVDIPVALDCTNPIQSLDATGSSSGTGFDIEWTGPGIIADGMENTLTPTIDQAGLYVLTITNTQNGCIKADSANVIANTDAPTGALIDSEDPSCFGDQNGFIHVDQVLGGDSPYQYSLNTAVFSNNNLFNNLTAGEYSIEVVDVNGCKWDTTITLAEPSKITIDLGSDIELGLGEHGTVQATVNLAPNQMDTLIWSPDKIIECIDVSCLEANIYASNTVTLSATVYDLNGCEATDDIYVLVNKIRKVYVPNVFSPNGDGQNDIFFVMGDEDQIVSIKKFMVLSRWGEKIFEETNFQPNDMSKGWDGYFRNEIMNPGVFVYYAEVEYIDGFVEILTGDVTIVK
jgi:gliding motility-associated-like protein